MQRREPSEVLHGEWSTAGSRWFHHRSQHCLSRRLGRRADPFCHSPHPFVFTRSTMMSWSSFQPLIDLLSSLSRNACLRLAWLGRSNRDVRSMITAFVFSHLVGCQGGSRCSGHESAQLRAALGERFAVMPSVQRLTKGDVPNNSALSFLTYWISLKKAGLRPRHHYNGLRPSL
jgi:hypothetical protein